MRFLVCCLVLVLLAQATVFAKTEFELKPLKPTTEPAADATVRWVAPDDSSWQQGEPTFKIASEKGEPAAAGWVAVTDEAILLKVVVTDAEHVQKQTGNDIWDGDGLQLGIDATGEGAPGMPADARYLGAHGAGIAVALTKNGPEAWAHSHGRAGAAGDASRLKPMVRRDEAAKTTTYDLRLPWSEFQAKCGICPRFGLSVQVNDMDETGQRTAVLWGGAAGQPNLFKKLQVGAPPKEWVGTYVGRQNLLRKSDSGEVIVAAASPSALAVQVKVGGTVTRFDLPKTQQQEISRFAVLAHVDDLPAAAIPIRVQVVDSAGGRVLAEEQVTLANAADPVLALQRKLAELAATASEAVLARHFDSAASVVATEWTSAWQIASQDPSVAAECAEYAARVLDHLQTYARSFGWDAYRTGRRMLVLSFRSPADRTLQYYLLSLPRDWDPNQAYPLIVYMHGMGDPSPVKFLAGTFDPPAPTTQPAGSKYPDDPPAFYMMAWGRGNHGYRDLAERDVLDGVADVMQSFKVDKQRVYLTGHSMGGFGTWSLAVTHPDMWAAVAICAGGPWWAPDGIHLGSNLRGIPVLVWHGTADGAVNISNAYAMQAELRDNGVEPVMRIIPGRGHNMADDDSVETTHWLLQQPKREMPKEFGFVGYGPDHLSAYGIRMGWSPADSFSPRFTCRIDGSKVYLDTRGVKDLSVQLGEGGLGLSGEVTLYWNRQEVYTGPARNVDLPTDRPAGRRR